MQCAHGFLVHLSSVGNCMELSPAYSAFCEILTGEILMTVLEIVVAFLVFDVSSGCLVPGA